MPYDRFLLKRWCVAEGLLAIDFGFDFNRANTFLSTLTTLNHEKEIFKNIHLWARLKKTEGAYFNRFTLLQTRQLKQNLTWKSPNIKYILSFYFLYFLTFWGLQVYGWWCKPGHKNEQNKKPNQNKINQNKKIRRT